MARYAMWDKQTDIYTLGKDEHGRAHWTAQEYISANAPWAASPAVKVIVGGGTINGTVFMEFEATKEFYKKQGASISDEMSDEEVLTAIEAFEDAQNAPSTEPGTEERTAAALEFLAMNSLPDETV